MSSLTKDNIKFIAVARAASSDAANESNANLLLGSYVPPNFSTTEKVYHAMVTKVLQAPTWSEQVAPKSRHSLDCEDANHKFHFKMDSEFRIYILVATEDYPLRLAFQALDSLRSAIVDKGSASLIQKTLSCEKESGLTKELKPVLSQILDKFDDRTKLDKIAEVQLQVDQVKDTMHNNISAVLANSEKIDIVEEKTIHLNEQAKAFRQTGKSLQRKMWWKNMKLNLMIGSCFMLFLIILLASLGVFSSSDKSDTSTDNSANDTGKL